MVIKLNIVAGYNDPIIAHKNPEGSVEMQPETHIIKNGKISLIQIPSEFYRVQINGMTELYKHEDTPLDSTNYRVDYSTGIIMFDSSLEGNQVTVSKYYGDGYWSISSTRVHTKLNNDGSISETLKDIEEEIDNALNLSDQIQEKEDIRQTNEIIRQQQEQDRQVSTSNAINILNETNSEFKVWENYDGLKNYVPLNKVQYQGSSYVNIVACNGILPTNTEHWQLIASKGVDGAGDMTKAVYDTNNDGVVDMSEDSKKLGGIIASDYASKTYVDDQVGLIIDTGVPKPVEYEYRIIGLAGQSKFDIPLETFDKNTDIVSLYVNTTYWDRTKYVVTNKVGSTLGYITLITPLEEDKNMVIQVNKNVPMGQEGSTSGSVLSDGSVDDRKLTSKAIDDTIVPPIDSNIGLLGDIINWFGNMFKGITGKSTWKERPTKNLEELNSDLVSHMADTMSYFAFSSRELSLEGAQVISGLPFVPKALIIESTASGTKKISHGRVAQNGSFSIAANAENGNFLLFAEPICLIDTVNNQTRATITINPDKTLTFNWSKTGAGATGLAQIRILALSHGGV